MILCNSYFSGAGLMDAGLEQGGLTVQQSFEIDPACVAVNQANSRAEVVACDISRKLVAAEKPCDVRVFTYPCTKYSTIADIHGTRTGDELYLHALRHMVIDPPEVWVCENVPGMRKFPLVMEVLTRLPGYYVTVFCPIGSQTWLPQKRDRLFVIGSRRNFLWRPPEDGARIQLANILESDPQPDYPDYINRRMSGEYRDKPIVSDPARGDIAPCCVAHYSKDLSTRLVKDDRFPNGVRPYTVREYARLQGVPDSFRFDCLNSEAYKMIGNGVSVPAARWIGSEISRYFNNNTRN